MMGTDKTNAADDNKTFDLGLRMVSNKDLTVFTIKKLSQLTKPSITKKVMINILHTK